MSFCCKPLKTYPSGERCVVVSLKEHLLYQICTVITDLCLLLISLKMSIAISNWGFIWKYKRAYARKS